MPTYDAELLGAARRLLRRPKGRPGRLPSARIRRSISTSYYALFHFILEETGLRIVGVPNDLRSRRHILTRTVTHKGIKTTFDKVRGRQVDSSVEDFLRPIKAAGGAVTTPPFIQQIARAFLDAQSKRHDADYDLNKKLSETDARLLLSRIARVIDDWKRAKTPADRDFKHAICILIFAKGSTS